MSGAGTDEVTQAVKEASEIYPFMKSLEPYIKPRKTVSNFKNVGAEQEFDEDTEEESRPLPQEVKLIVNLPQILLAFPGIVENWGVQGFI